MKKRTSNVSRRIVSLLLSLVLALTLVTPAAFATEVVGGSGTTIVEGDTNPADANPSGDNEGKDDENKDTEHGGDEQPTNPGDEDKNPGEGEGDDANKPDEDKKDEAPDGENKDEENKDEQPVNEPIDEIDTQEGKGENAVDAVTVWDGTVDIGWYIGHEKDTKFEISTAAQLAGLAQLVNGTAKDSDNKTIAAVTFSGKTIILTEDINLNTDDVPASGNEWTPIGNSDNSFNGIFDGDGHTVGGLYVPDTTECPGLFGMGGDDAVIRNLIVVGTICAGESAGDARVGVGGICAASYGKVQNCGFYGTIKADDSVYNELFVGGIAGGYDTTVEKCWYFDTDGNSKADGVGSFDSIIGCYHNVSGSKSGEYKENGEFTNGTVASLLNASLPKGYKMWKPGTKHPEFLQTGEKLVVLEKFLPTTDVQVKVNDADYAFVDASTNLSLIHI